jgi:hypothetical protein
MSIEHIVKVEFPALSRTIRDYTTDYYISSYAEQICSVKYPSDEEILLILINKLISWYESEMKRIQEGEYIHSKESHKKSYELLLEVRELLKSK